MKLGDSKCYMQLCRTDTDDFYDEWNENVKEYSLNLPSFDTNKDVLLYIKDSELVYKKTNETTSGREHLKSVQYEDRYCFKLNDFLYIYIYIIFTREQDMMSSHTYHKIFFDNHFTEDYL